MRSLMAAVVLAAVALVGCGADEETATTTTAKKAPATTGSKSSALWSCETENAAVVCTAALPKNTSDQAAYVCAANESAKRCPDANALTNVSGLDALLQRANAGEVFKKMPWACLVTGTSQFECIRDIGRTSAGKALLSGTNGGAAGAGAERPAPPEGTCDSGEWQKYFAKLASFEYQAAGVDITFPDSIFDANASFTDVAMGAAGGAGGAQAGGVPGGLPNIPAGIPGLPNGTDIPSGDAPAAAPDSSAPSCHSGEWQMRQQSWLDVVMAGCMGNLTNANLVWCQQAANHAPSTGKCTATGTW